ncbi:MAG: hypothetical protein NTY38_17915, partial [Acidobacteria bacterium]|nr:hypothetical protein [Acidobacteriota bacterium]
LFHTGDRIPAPAALAAGTFISTGSAGYDGQFYRYMAHDPFLQKGYAAHIDSPRLRYRRILFPVAAFLLALGRDSWIDTAYIGLVLLSAASGVYWCSRICIRHNLHEACGLLLLLMPGVIASVDRMVADGVLTSLTVGFLLYIATGERWKLYPIAIALPLAKEIGLLFTAGLVGAALLRRQWREAAFSASSAIPAALWFLFVQLGVRQPEDLSASLRVWNGIILRLQHPRPDANAVMHALLRAVDSVALAGLALSILLAVLVIRQEPLREVRITMALFVMLAVLLTLLSPDPDPYGYSRPISPLLAYLLIWGLTRRRWLPAIASLMLTPAVAVYPAAELARCLGLRIQQ